MARECGCQSRKDLQSCSRKSKTITITANPTTKKIKPRSRLRTWQTQIRCYVSHSRDAELCPCAADPADSDIACWVVGTWLRQALTYLAKAYADLGQFDDAWRSIGEAVDTTETTKETWFEAEVNRIAGEIALMAPQNDSAKAEAHFERALSVARQQQAKSWELRAAMSLARLCVTRARCRQRANCLLRSTAGLRKASTRLI